MRETTKADDAFSDLHVLASIEVICTNSILRSSVGRTAARKIASICRDAQQKAVRIYDRSPLP